MTKTQIEFPIQIDLEEKISKWAHDLRSPFNQILGFTKIMLNGQSGPLTDLQKEDLSTVYHSSLRAMSQINNMIEIARLQRNQRAVSRDVVELQPFLDQSIEKWHKDNPGTELPIATILLANSPTAELDKKILQWILHGFFSYMAAYSNGTGSITLEVADEDGFLVLTLRQTGITKRGFEEMTMAMFAYICRAYIELHKGEIRHGEKDETEALIQFTLPR